MSFEILTHGTSKLALYSDGPTWDGRPCATVGQCDFASAEEGAALLELAADRARAYALLGPMNGDTWHPYRVVSETTGRANFPMEPISGAFDLLALQRAGFETVSQYASTCGPLDRAIGNAPVRVPSVDIQAWDGKNGEALVDHIFNLSKDSFARNNFFKPVDLNTFRALYHPLINRLDPRFVLLADHASGGTCGFAFGYPADDKTVVLKTYASGIKGVGHALADAFHRAARDAGFEQIIHALMQADNISLAHSRMHGLKVFRRYDLMARLL